MVDFEYASNNERAYELALWFDEMAFPDTIEREMIEAYFGRWTPEIHARIAVLKALGDLKWATWGDDPGGRLDPRFRLLQIRNLEAHAGPNPVPPSRLATLAEAPVMGVGAPPILSGDEATKADFLAFAHRLADFAAPLARHYFRTELPVEAKADASPVTAADRAIESLLRAEIRSVLSRPRHPRRGGGR